MKLSPDQSNATIAYYSWRCMQLEVQASGMQQLIDQQRAELERLRGNAGQSAAAGATRRANPMDAEPRALGIHDPRP